jgi:cytoskeletal protein RodZ
MTTAETASERTTPSFGRYLQSIRLEKGITLKAVARETRIRPETLHHIEEEDHQRLPDEVYVKGFLRAYAKAIGADGDEAVNRYNSRLAVQESLSQTETDLHQPGGVFWRRLLLSIGAVLCLIAGTLYAVTAWRDHRAPGEDAAAVTNERSAAEPITRAPSAILAPPEPEEVLPVQEPEDRLAMEEKSIPAPERVVPTVEEAAATPGPSVPADDKLAATGPSRDAAAAAPVVDKKLRLNIDAIEETWLKIIVDEQRPKQYSLYPGDHIELEGLRSFNLLVGNAAGIRISLNGKSVQLKGKSGQVVNLNLP